MNLWEAITAVVAAGGWGEALALIAAATMVGALIIWSRRWCARRAHGGPGLPFPPPARPAALAPGQAHKPKAPPRFARRLVPGVQSPPGAEASFHKPYGVH